MSKRERVLVVGLDGATFNLIDPWVEDGKLPTLGRIVEEGARAPLKSTIPYISAPAWASFMTGKNPGKHNLFDFVVRERNGYGMRLVNASTIRSKTLWTLLSQGGKRLGVLNCPATYPPQRINGYLITGMLTPTLKSDFAYPPSLKEEFMRAVPGYMIEPAVASGDRLGTKNRMALGGLRSAQKRVEAAHFLLGRLEEWDFFMVVFCEPDRLQTYLWDDMDARHPRHEPAFGLGGKILELYQLLDASLAELMERYVDERTTLLILSDHGFAGVDKFFYPNKWLEEEGYLVMKRHRGTLGVQRAKGLLRNLGLAYPAKRLVKAFFPDWAFPNRLRSVAFIRDVDWSKTRAFWGADNGLTINLRGREPQGIVEPEEYDSLREELIERLSDLREPSTGEKVVEKAFRREELYSGPYAQNGPDLRVVWKEHPEQKKTYFSAGELWSEEAFAYSSQTGDHTPWGILLAYGNHIRPGARLDRAEIIDLAPTILHLLGLPTPEDMDGKVLVEILEERFLSSRPIRQSPPSDVPPGEVGYGDGESEEVVKRLKGLGYL